MTIAEYQQKVETWIHTYGVRYFNEPTNMMLLMEELDLFLRKILSKKYYTLFKLNEMVLFKEWFPELILKALIIFIMVKEHIQI